MRKKFENIYFFKDKKMSSELLGFFQVFRCAGLPDEITCKILYEFCGVQHPIVGLLLEKTDVESVFSKMSLFSRKRACLADDWSILQMPALVSNGDRS